MSKFKTPPQRDAATMLTLQQTAEHLQLSVKTVRRKIAAGELIAHRMGNRWRVAEEDLQRFKFQCRTVDT
jgi:excisionase family DNA binding protein